MPTNREIIASAIASTTAAGRQLTEADVRRIVSGLIPPAILQMDRGGPKGGIEGRLYLGLVNGHAVWGTPEAKSTAEEYPFKGSKSSGGVTLNMGSWTRNGIKLDAGGDEIAVGPDDYVWLELTNSGAGDPAVEPDGLLVDCGSTLPDDTATDNIYWTIGKMTGGVWSQWWTGGDIDDTSKSDANSYHFKGSVTAGGLTVSAGAWTRNGIQVDFSELEIAAGENDYVYLELLYEGPYDFDPALLPDTIQLVSSSTRPDDSGIGGIYFVLGKMSDGVWEQWWTGGDIDDVAVVPDGNTNAETEFRRTLEFYPTINQAHKGELQLYNALDAKHGAVPVMMVDPNVPDEIAMQWFQIDSEDEEITHQPYMKSIGIDGNDRIGIFGFDGALDQQMATKQALTASPDEQTLGWAYPVLYGGLPCLTGSGTGPVEDGDYFAPVVSEIAGAVNTNADGITLTLTGHKFCVADGRMDIRYNAYPDVGIDLSSLRITPAAHSHYHTDITDWDDAISAWMDDTYQEWLEDNNYHYWDSNVAETVNFETSGLVTVGSLSLAGHAVEQVRISVIDPDTGESTVRMVLALAL